MSWTKKRSRKEAARFPNSAFPDGSRKKAKRRCRNPDGDAGGPWCYVDRETENEGDDGEEDVETVERDYCDIPFCDEQGKGEALIELNV